MMKTILIILVMGLLQACGSARMGEQLQQGKAQFSAGDYKQAFHQLLPLASEGNADAQYAVGYMYYYGYGVTQDNESGLFWMNEAAAQHHVAAIKALEMIRQGH
jgi:TPR repeat protein